MDFSFHGFDDLGGRVARRLGNTTVRGGEPSAIVVTDAVYVPAVDHGRAVRTAGVPRMTGGILASDGKPIDAAHLRRNRGKVVGGLSESTTVEPSQEVDDQVIYLGWLSNHFGLALLEGLARVWFLKDANPSLPLLFHFPDAPVAFPAWLRSMLEAFGASPERIILPDAPTRIRKLIIPEPLFEQLHGAHERMIQPFRAVAERVAGDVRPSTQPLYLSRRLLTSAHRPIVGEGELEDVLRENGFLVAYPETMTFEEQVRLANAHATIFSGIGSAAHNVLFALHRPTLHLLANGDRIPSNFFLCSALAGVPTSFVNCIGSGERPNFAEERKQRKAENREDVTDGSAIAGAGSQATPQLLDAPAIVGYLAERGFLKRTLRASMVGCDPALKNRYDEAWFYARLRTAADQGETLPTGIANEAAFIAAGSWPVTLMLARYHAHVDGDGALVASLLEQFADLAAAEYDMNRLAYYHADVANLVRLLTNRCNPATHDRLDDVLRERFRIPPKPTHPAAVDA